VNCCVGNYNPPHALPSPPGKYKVQIAEYDVSPFLPSKLGRAKGEESAFPCGKYKGLDTKDKKRLCHCEKPVRATPCISLREKRGRHDDKMTFVILEEADRPTKNLLLRYYETRSFPLP